MIEKVCRFVILFFTITYHSAFAQSKELPNNIINDWVNKECFSHASLGIYMEDGDTGETIASYNDEKSLIPASTQKIFTTAAALQILGPDYKFVTRLSYDGEIINDTIYGDLILKGGGDPTLGSEYFKNNYSSSNFLDIMVDSLRNRNIKFIYGDIVTDVSIYEDQTIPDTWVWGDLGNYYGAGPCGLTLYDNMCKIHFSSPSVAGEPVKIISVSPDIPDVNFENLVLSSDINKDKTCVYGSPWGGKRIIRGTIPKGKTDFVIKSSIPDPAYLMASELKNKLKQNGISFSGTIKKEKYIQNHNNRFNICSIYSPSLMEIIMKTNYFSVNLFAEHLLKQLDYEKNGKGTTKGGVKIVIDYWKNHVISDDGIYMCDGSGLSRYNQCTPKQMVKVLLFMKNKSQYGDLFFKSIPDASEGTLYYFHKENFPYKSLKAKSGSMTHVRCFAGCIKTVSGKDIFFSVMINQFLCNQYFVCHQVEDLLKEIRMSL
ncbi:MAG: D-alanyl-D-alanine carboxypeptidase/D-alanyl-D-alanine-endopeptidase [Prolixibacteraceae bacterium]|nr:D-alanyl-D-alanine carboxypeptidase/D-alanyl-D-alanine-endopeptidase [Prolixibacteraceae bacterium]